MTSFAYVNLRLQQVIASVIFWSVTLRQQRNDRQKSFLAQKRPLRNLDVGTFRQQHPHRNLQSPPRWVDD
jgi:hypothetical protein